MKKVGDDVSWNTVNGKATGYVSEILIKRRITATEEEEVILYSVVLPNRKLVILDDRNIL